LPEGANAIFGSTCTHNRAAVTGVAEEGSRLFRTCLDALQACSPPHCCNSPTFSRNATWLNALIAAAREWNDGNVFKRSAAVSFDTLFSLAAITTIAVGVAGIFFGKEAATK
jgi:hypothetical protein